ncbi:MAG TPA: hypothetical protein VMV46_16375 [Thermoanaerobaculia bacterium]|nr:hypothetical protein [Thermoanaerobaculia bacterium]
MRELEDGRVLAHCFAGCDPAAVLEAIGLELRDLFAGDRGPGSGWSPASRRERRVPAEDLLRTLGYEALVVVCGLARLVDGHRLTPEAISDLGTAAARIDQVVRSARRAGWL